MSEDKPTDLGSASTHAEALALSHRATEQRRRCTELSGENKGKAINQACERLIAQAQANEQKADRLNLVSEALKIREEAARIWNRNAPRDSELDAARKAMGEASEELKRAEGVSVIAADAKMKAAIQHSADLSERRKQADTDYERAEKRARAKLSEAKGRKDGKERVGGSTTMDLPGKKAGSPARTKPAPGPSKGAAAAVKPAGAASAPSTVASRTSTAGVPAQEKSLTDLLRQTGQLPAGQPQQAPQQPQVAPAAATAAPTVASARPDGRKLDDALKSSDIPGVPVPFGMPASPSPTAVANTSGSATAQPSPTSGSSAAGLQTEAEVAGRPGSPRTWAAGATGLINATGFNAAQSQASTAQAGIGQPGMVPPFAAGGGPRAAKGTPKIHAAHPTIEYDDGVVRGGTIAQNRPDFDEEAKRTTVSHQ